MSDPGVPAVRPCFTNDEPRSTARGRQSGPPRQMIVLAAASRSTDPERSICSQPNPLSEPKTKPLLPLNTTQTTIPLSANPEWQKAQRGELYYAFAPGIPGTVELIQVRAKCARACEIFNNSTAGTSRRNRIRMWCEITHDKRPLPPPAATQEEDDALFVHEPWVEAPFRADYGVNVLLGEGTFLNFNSTFVDTCPITIGARTLVGPHCSFYSGTHPLDPAVRNGLAGPESGKPITIGEDCWLGGNVTVLPGVNIGRGSTVGAGSVVTKDVPAFHVVAGNPARVLRKIESTLDPSSSTSAPLQQELEGAEVPMSKS